MLLETMAEFSSVEEAAKEMAGNWLKWRCFVWFGSSDFEKSENILLGYICNHQSGVMDEANLKTVVRELQPYFGMAEDKTKQADDYGADFWGDKKLLTGIMVRVYDNEGKITEAFQKLFDLTRDFEDDIPLDGIVFDSINKLRMPQFIEGHMYDVIPKWSALPQKERDDILCEVANCLIEDDENADYVDEEKVRQVCIDLHMKVIPLEK